MYDDGAVGVSALMSRKVVCRNLDMTPPSNQIAVQAQLANRQKSPPEVDRVSSCDAILRQNIMLSFISVYVFKGYFYKCTNKCLWKCYFWRTAVRHLLTYQWVCLVFFFSFLLLFFSPLEEPSTGEKQKTSYNFK